MKMLILFENAIKAHNKSNNVINVLEFIPKINQGHLQNAQTAAGPCFCLGKCRFH